MLRQRLLFAIPVVAIGCAGALLMGPARAKPALGARLYAAPSPDGQTRSLRVVALYRLDRVEELAALGELRLVEGDRELWRGATGSDGVAEIDLPEPLPPGATISLRRGDEELVGGALDAGKSVAVTAGLASVSGQTDGPLHVRVDLVRGAMIPPFEETLRVAVTDEGGAPSRGTVVVELTGASPARSELVLGPNGNATLLVRPEAQMVELEARATNDGKTGSLAARIPEVLGGVWLDPASADPLRFVAPSPRRSTLVSFHDARGRVAGRLVPMSESPDGFFRGEVARPAGLEGGAYAITSSDPQERAASTTAWPLPPTLGSPQLERLGPVLEGLTSALDRERVRARRARLLATGGLSLAAAFEIAILLSAARSTRRALASELPRTAAERPARQGILVLGAAFCVVLIFASVAVTLTR